MLSNPPNFRVGKCEIRFDKTNVILDSYGVTNSERFTVVFPKASWLRVAQDIIKEFKQDSEKLK